MCGRDNGLKCGEIWTQWVDDDVDVIYTFGDAVSDELPARSRCGSERVDGKSRYPADPGAIHCYCRS